MKHSSAAAAGPVYNVYAEVIDPKNMMPANPNQKPAPGQKAELSTARQESSIPKGGTEASTWLYPSPQMFYNALVRKQKADGVREEDVSVVVAIHNNMNERTWRSLLSWEESHKAYVRRRGRRTQSRTDEEGGRSRDELSSLALTRPDPLSVVLRRELGPGCPKLRRFMGRPYDLSPKARVRSWLGGGYPFDRHDWFIDRGDGVERRYVIDYYFDTEANAKATTLEESLAAIQVDVRPALDSPGAVLDRLLAFPGRLIEASKRKRFYADGMDPRKMPKEAIAHGDSAVVASGGGATAAAVSLALDTRGGAAAPAAPAPVGKVRVRCSSHGARRVEENPCRCALLLVRCCVAPRSFVLVQTQPSRSLCLSRFLLLLSLALSIRLRAPVSSPPLPLGLASGVCFVERLQLSPAQLESIDKNCKKLRERLQAAKTEEERSAAYIALNYCIGRVACPSEAERFMAAVEATTTNDEAEQAAFQTMYGCIVEQFTGKAASERA